MCRSAAPAMSPLLPVLLAALWTVSVPQAESAAAPQQQVTASLQITADQLSQLIDRAVTAATQPLAAKLDTRIDTLDARLDTLDTRLDTMDARLDALDGRPDTRLDTLDARLNRLDARLDILDARLDTMDARPDTRLDTRDARPDSRLNTLDARLDTLNNTLDTMDSRLDTLHTSVDGLTERQRTQDSELQSVSQRIHNQTSEMLEKTKQLDDHHIQLQEHQSRLDTQKTQIDACRSQLDNHASQIASTMSQLDTVLNRTELQQAQIEDSTGGLQNISEVRYEPVRDCSDLPAGSASGVYLLQPGLSSTDPVPTYCDLDYDGGSWTVFQRRADVQPRQDFYQNWAAYKNGFGKLESEFWWGLENIWAIISADDRKYELRINLEDFENGKRHATYKNFSISDESDGYRLSLTNYVGDAGDAMEFHNGMRFSTKDEDNDNNSDSCANLWKGGWWYNNCHHSNLNGLYLGGPDTDYSEGINWAQWRGFEYSLKTTTMKMRPT